MNDTTRKTPEDLQRELDALAHVTKAEVAPGDCYANALRFVQANPSWTVVHGIALTSGGVSIGHAWAEKEAGGVAWVYDPSHDWMGPRVLYDQRGRVSYAVRYTLEEAQIHALRTGHFGCWDEQIAQAVHRNG